MVKEPMKGQLVLCDGCGHLFDVQLRQVQKEGYLVVYFECNQCSKDYLVSIDDKDSILAKHSYNDMLKRFREGQVKEETVRKNKENLKKRCERLMSTFREKYPNFVAKAFGGINEKRI